MLADRFLSTLVIFILLEKANILITIINCCYSMSVLLQEIKKMFTWQLWDTELVREISFHSAVERITVLGTLCAIELKMVEQNTGYVPYKCKIMSLWIFTLYILHYDFLFTGFLITDACKIFPV